MDAAENALPLVLIEAFNNGRVADASGRMVPLNANVSRAEALLLYRTVRNLAPDRCVEIGLAKGVSALAILQACEDNGRGASDVIDPFQQDYGDTGLAMIERAGLQGRLNFHRKFPEEVIPAMETIDFAFIDASHLFDLTLTEFVLVDKKLRVGGLVGFHDLWMEEQRAVVRYILRNRRYSLWKPERKRRCLRSSAARVLRFLPLAEKVFRQKLLRPYEALGAGNLVFLCKDGGDNGRSWKNFRRF